MEILRGEPWYSKGVIFDFHPALIDDRESLGNVLDGVDRLTGGSAEFAGAIWVAEIRNVELFKRLRDEAAELGLRLLYDANLEGSTSHDAIVTELGYWLEKGVNGFKSEVGVGGWHVLPAEANTLCSRLAPGRGIDALEDSYFDLPALGTAFQACSRHLAHRVTGLDLAALEWEARSFREFIGTFEDHLSSDDWPRYSATGIERAWLAGGAGKYKARLLTLMLLTLRGTPVVPGMISDVERARMVREERNPDSDINFMRHILALRSMCPALWLGDYHALNFEEEDVMGYVRETELQRLTLVLNFSSHVREVKVTGPVGSWIGGTHLVQGDGDMYGDCLVTLAGFEGRVYELPRSLA